MASVTPLAACERERAGHLYSAVLKAGWPPDDPFLPDAVLHVARTSSGNGRGNAPAAVRAVMEHVARLRRGKAVPLLDHIPWSGHERIRHRTVEVIEVEAEGRADSDTLRCAAQLLRGGDPSVAALVAAAKAGRHPGSASLVSSRLHLETLIAELRLSVPAFVPRPPPAPAMTRHPNAQAFYDGHVLLLQHTATMFYRTLRKQCSTIADATAIASVVALALSRGLSVPLGDAALRVAGSVPRFISRLAGRGGATATRHAVSSDVVRVDVLCGGTSATDVYYRGVGEHLQYGAASVMVPRAAEAGAPPAPRSGAATIAELVERAEKAASERPSISVTITAVDLFDTSFLDAAYDRGRRESWAGAAYAGAIVGRHAATVKRLLPTNPPPRGWASFILPVLLGAAQGTPEDPLWEVMLRTACRHTGWLYALLGSGSLSAAPT